MMPVPGGTVATVFPLGAKLAWLLASTRLRKTRQCRPSFLGRSGSAKTRMPPELSVARLSKTSARVEFSTSMPATFCRAVLLRMTMSSDWPT